MKLTIRNDIYMDALGALPVLLLVFVLGAWSQACARKPRAVAHRCEFSTVLDRDCLVDGGAR
jgi:hypothetical protein